jgi:hypothetical protein
MEIKKHSLAVPREFLITSQLCLWRCGGVAPLALKTFTGLPPTKFSCGPRSSICRYICAEYLCKIIVELDTACLGEKRMQQQTLLTKNWPLWRPEIDKYVAGAPELRDARKRARARQCDHHHSSYPPLSLSVVGGTHSRPTEDRISRRARQNLILERALSIPQPARAIPKGACPRGRNTPLGSS